MLTLRHALFIALVLFTSATAANAQTIVIWVGGGGGGGGGGGTPAPAPAPDPSTPEGVAQEGIDGMNSVADEFESAWGSSGGALSGYEADINALSAADDQARARTQYTRARGRLIQDARRAAAAITITYIRYVTVVREEGRDDLVQEITDEWLALRDRAGTVQADALNTLDAAFGGITVTLTDRIVIWYVRFVERTANYQVRITGSNCDHWVRLIDRRQRDGQAEAADRIAQNALEALQRSRDAAVLRVEEIRDRTIARLESLDDGSGDTAGLISQVTAAADSAISRIDAAEQACRNHIQTALSD